MTEHYLLMTATPHKGDPDNFCLFLELRRLIVGKPAPEIEGEDLDGQSMKLSDYRGRVVVLTFWWPGYIEASDHRKLVEHMAGKPFAFIGVYRDDDLTKAKADVEKYAITWPSFRDKRDGPISTTWNVTSWPNTWVLDRQGFVSLLSLSNDSANDSPVCRGTHGSQWFHAG